MLPVKALDLGEVRGYYSNNHTWENCVFPSKIFHSDTIQVSDTNSS